MKAFPFYVRQDGVLTVHAETYKEALMLARGLLDSGSSAIAWEKPVILEREGEDDDDDDDSDNGD